MRLLWKALPLALWASLLPAVGFAQEEVVAKLVDSNPRVDATPPGAAISKNAEIRKGAEVKTGKNPAGATIAVGPKPVRGMMKMGPESRITFKQWVVNAATGGEVGFFVELGNLLVAFTPPKPNDILVEPGRADWIDPKVDKWIETPTVHRIRLRGTMVHVRVAPDGTTTVFVLEGSATVESNTGAAVELPAGTGTTVRPGEGPTPPAPISPDSVLVAFDPSIPPPSFGDPPLLSPRDLNLDLPKVDRP
jgi:hypothetical protein